jgi:hypothetical protein
VSGAPQPTLALDHIVIAVEALAPASASFTYARMPAAGGGVHQGLPTANSLFALDGGAYGELLALTENGLRKTLRAHEADGTLAEWLKTQPQLAQRFLPAFTQADGVADLVLRTSSLAEALERLREADVEIEGPVPMSRMRPDGVEVAWQLALPASRTLPFLIEDVTDMALRVPVPASSAIAPRIVHVAIAVHDRGYARRAWQALLGERIDDASGFTAAGTQIELRERPREEREGVCAVTLSGAAPGASTKAELAGYGIRFE